MRPALATLFAAALAFACAYFICRMLDRHRAWVRRQRELFRSLTE